MTDEFYAPDPSVIMAQSVNNKQGRGGEIDPVSKEGVNWLINAAYEHGYDAYRTLLGERSGGEVPLYDAYDLPNPILDESFPGIAREMARIVLPVGNYTELYWKQNLHNMLHLLKLRADPHAQYEIRVLAEAIYDLVQPLFPLCVEAWEDYVRYAKTVSRMEAALMLELMGSDGPKATLDAMIATAGGAKAFAETRGMSQRELTEFISTWNLG